MKDQESRGEKVTSISQANISVYAHLHVNFLMTSYRR